jgi:hypothetical protein
MSSNTIVVLSGVIAIGLVWALLMTGSCAVLVRANLAGPVRAGGTRSRRARAPRPAAAGRGARRAPVTPARPAPPATA